MKDEFIHFLHVSGIYFTFHEYMIGAGEYLCSSELVESVDAEFWITDAFNWDDTREGYVYWSTVACYWYDIVKREL